MSLTLGKGLVGRTFASALSDGLLTEAGEYLQTEDGDDLELDVAAAFSRASLPLTLWHKAAFSGSPWTPTASAGTSGSNGNFAEGTHPPTVGTAVTGGLTPATFNGTDELLTGAVASTYFGPGGSSVGSLWVLFKGAASPPAPGSGYDDPAMIADQATRIVIAFTSAGARFMVFDGAFNPHDIACADSVWALAQLKWDGANMHFRVNGGSWTTVANGSPDDTTYNVRFGLNYNGSAHFAGDIAEIGGADTVISDADFDNVLADIRTTYSLSL